ncbi:MAG: GTPase HflX [Ruminococcaceae bacterium]|nr:GTPase HflX [Oscillospiraceae bacterium]
MYELESKNRPERAILCSVDTGEFDAEVSIDELEELARTAGAEVVAKVIQVRNAPDTALFFGVGKLDEIKTFYMAEEVDLLIFDAELSPSQQRNIEKYMDTRVIDRTTLILDIFASRAYSKEGKLQVELAQLKYLLPRLVGKGLVLSRLGGGIGTRGPGETKLESDRRHIRRKIDSISAELKEVEKRRNIQRRKREKDGVETVVIVGYTNAGKSTLMNHLTEAGVLTENMLFATLDPTARGLTLPSGREVVLIDTVGLVRRLPYHLVEAFKSTLEEATSADVILNVCDASSPECAEHLEVTKELLKELGAASKPIISVMNKCDMVYDEDTLPIIGKTVFISALRGSGIDKLLEAIDEALPPDRKRCIYLFPYDDIAPSNEVREDGTVFLEEYTDEGLKIDVLCSTRIVNKLSKYIKEIF